MLIGPPRQPPLTGIDHCRRMSIPNHPMFLDARNPVVAVSFQDSASFDSDRAFWLQWSKSISPSISLIAKRLLGFQQTTLAQWDVLKGAAYCATTFQLAPSQNLLWGTRKHTDAVLLTLLLQNEISGLQVLLEGQWLDVPSIRGALLVNIGDLLQIISNDKLKSVEHRATANHVGPRISVPWFFLGHASILDKPFGPFKELTSEAIQASFVWGIHC
ncbi:hypothetical protein PTKIN_Ptkin09bG0044000 [Pterospermum kingtungense]